MEKRFKNGLVLGKFFPPHKGHFFLIETAAEQKGQLSKLPNLDQSTQPYQVLQKGNIRIGIIAPADSIATINRLQAACTT